MERLLNSSLAAFFPLFKGEGKRIIIEQCVAFKSSYVNHYNGWSTCN